MRTLPELREELDRVDADIVALLLRRADLALEVKAAKQKSDLETYSLERELEIIRRVRELAAKGRFPLTALEKIFGAIVSATRSLVGDLGVSYPGKEFSTTHRAALKQFGENIRAIPTDSVKESLSKLESGETHYAVLPIERRGEGLNSDTIDALLEHRFPIAGEIFLNTDNGMDRFFLIGLKGTGSTGSDKTTIVCALKERPGALSDLLTPFASAGITLTKIESKESPVSAWDHRFILEFIGHQDDTGVKEVVENLRKQSSSISILGSYPIAGDTYVSRSRGR